jgi:CRISPR-associated protein Cas6
MQNPDIPGDADIVDIQYSLSGASAIPADYADALWAALLSRLPWLADEPRGGVHPISGLSPASYGWNLSRRSRLSLRLPRHRLAAAAALAGEKLNLQGEVLAVGPSQVRELAHSPVIYAKFVAIGPASLQGEAIGELDFLAACMERFEALGIRPQIICGKAQRAQTTEGLLSGFSLLLAGIEPEINLQLQREGLGKARRHGCGIFVPHKTFAAVKTLE